MIDLRRLSRFGSDHFPVYIELSYEPEATSEQENMRAASEEQQEATEKIGQARNADAARVFERNRPSCKRDSYRLHSLDHDGEASLRERAERLKSSTKNLLSQQELDFGADALIPLSAIRRDAYVVPALDDNALQPNCNRRR